MDKYCKTQCNPNMFPDLEAVNSSVCEQCFSWSNHYSNCKAMTSERFASYWLFIFDLHNMLITGTLKHWANTTSRFRMDKILEDALADLKFESKWYGVFVYHVILRLWYMVQKFVIFLWLWNIFSFQRFFTTLLSINVICNCLLIRLKG